MGVRVPSLATDTGGGSILLLLGKTGCFSSLLGSTDTLWLGGTGVPPNYSPCGLQWWRMGEPYYMWVVVKVHPTRPGLTPLQRVGEGCAVPPRRNRSSGWLPTGPSHITPPLDRVGLGAPHYNLVEGYILPSSLGLCW